MKMRSVMLLAALLSSGCASHYAQLPKLAAVPSGTYLLGPGDALQVTVFGEEDLSGPLRVNDSGAVSMPLIGPVQAAGLTVPELQKHLIELLNTKAVKSPDVTVQINEYRPFFILGEVKNPGSYAYVPDMTVLTAVAIAGGYTFRASEEEVSVTRKNEGANREAQASRNSRVLPGDVVYVFERHF
jgi:polysaccharide export outer membrane protein